MAVFFFSHTAATVISRVLKKTRRNHTQPSKCDKKPPHAEYRIVPIDSTPLCNEALGAARTAMREISRLNKQIAEFERTIEPAFSRWERDNIGELLSRESELEAKIEALSELIEFATMQAFFTGKDPYEIYAKAAKGKASSAPEDKHAEATEDTDQREDEARARDAGYSPEEQDFRAHLRTIFGRDPDSMRKAEYRHMFSEYKTWRAKFEETTAAAASAKAKDIPARIKELYRHLVRRLHPDSGTQADPFFASLWHDLQEAYNNRDLERLEILLTITEVNKGGDSINSSLYHIRLVAKKMTSTLFGLEKRFAGIRKSDAWKFWHVNDRRQAEIKFRKAAKERVEDAEMDLAKLEAEIAHWKSEALQKQPNPPRKSDLKSPKPLGSSLQKTSLRKKSPSSTTSQTSFDF